MKSNPSPDSSSCLEIFISKAVSPPHLYSLREICEAGYGSIANLRRAIRDGHLQAVYASDRVKISAEALNAYVQASTERCASNGGDTR